MTLTATKKRDQRRNQRKDGPRNRWHGRAQDYDLNSQDFHLTVLQSRKGSKVKRTNIDSLVESFSWEDADVVTTGTIELRQPMSGRLRVAHGDIVVCRMRSGERKKARELWRMRLGDETETVSSGSVTHELVSPIDFLQRSKDDFKYKKEKEGAHKEGWMAHEITRDVCRKYDVKVGNLATPAHKITSMVKRNASPLDVINEAYKEANKKEGRQYVVEYRDGELHVRPLRYSRFMYELGGHLLEATMSKSLPEDFATRLTVTGTVDTEDDKEGKGKIEEVVTAKRLKKRYGLVHRILQENELKDAAQARKRGRRELRKSARRSRELTLTVPGMPQLRRGDAIKLRLRELNVTRIIFVKTVSHSVSGGAVQSDVTVRFQDEVNQLRKCEEKCRKAQERGKPEPKECNCQKAKEEDEKRPERNEQDGRS